MGGSASGPEVARRAHAVGGGEGAGGRPTHTVRRSRWILLPLLAAVLATACGGGDGEEPEPTSTSAPDTTAVIEVTTVPPTTEPPPETTVFRGTPRTVTTQSTAIGPGTARIVGVVNGPEGPVTGAIVRVERFVGSAVADVEIQSEGGTWSLESVLGGSYRVTIYRPPDLAQVAPDVFFLAADETKTLTTTLIRLGTNSVTAEIQPNPPLIGVPAVLTVRFGSGGVDADGRVIVTPRPGVRVQLNLSSNITLQSSAIVVSGGDGSASWQVVCLQPGVFPASILVGNASSALSLPPCTAASQPAAEAPATTEP